MNALKPKPPFQVLVMSEESRLGREAIETGYVLKQILDAGVRVFFYLEDRERVLDTAMDKVMLSLTNFASEVEREKARQRTYDAMLRKAKNLQVTGGKVYGYDNHDVLSPTVGPDGRRSASAWSARSTRSRPGSCAASFSSVRRGKGSPGSPRRSTRSTSPHPAQAKGWAPTAIREMLHRSLYRGEIVWNKTQKVVRGGTKKQVDRPQAEWLTIPAPDLQIVSTGVVDGSPRADRAGPPGLRPSDRDRPAPRAPVAPGPGVRRTS